MRLGASACSTVCTDDDLILTSWAHVGFLCMQARRNIDTDSKEVDKTATNSYSRSNTNKGDVGQYEEARIKNFRTGRLPFSDDEPETFSRDYFRRRNDGDPSVADDLKGEKFLMAVKEVRLPFQEICKSSSA